MARSPSPTPSSTTSSTRSARPDASGQVRRGWLLLAAFAWNTWVWTGRIYNMLTGSELETRSTEFIVVHLVLYGVSLAVGAVVGVIGWRLRREALADSREQR